MSCTDSVGSGKQKDDLFELSGLINYVPADVDNEYVNVVGMDTKPTVAAYIEMNYGIRHDFIGWVVLIIFAYIIVFLGVAAVSLKKLNF